MRWHRPEGWVEMAYLKTAWMVGLPSASNASLFQPCVVSHVDWQSDTKEDAAHRALLNYDLHQFDRWSL